MAANSFSRERLTLMEASAKARAILGIDPGEEGAAARGDLAAQPEMTMMSSPRMSGGFIGSALRGGLAFIGHERREAAKEFWPVCCPKAAP
jgi:hypothetical protein